MRDELAAALAILWLLMGGHAAAQTFDAADFVPKQGDFSVFLVNGVQQATTIVMGTTPINGVQADVIRWTGGPLDQVEGAASYDPAAGGFLYQTLQHNVFLDGLGFVTVLQQFVPPIQSTGTTIQIGDILSSSGATAQTFFTSPQIVFRGTYTATYRFALIETITVPFGTFEAIQRQLQFDTRLEVSPGDFIDTRSTARDWLVPGLGAVRIENTLPEGGMDRYDLIDTNRVFIPAPALSGAQIASLVILIVLRRRYALMH